MLVIDHERYRLPKDYCIGCFLQMDNKQFYKPTPSIQVTNDGKCNSLNRCLDEVVT